MFKWAVICAAVGAAAVIGAGAARADTVLYSGGSSSSPADGTADPFAGTALFTASANQLVITLTNTSPHTLSAGETFRSVDFEISGLTTPETSGTALSSSSAFQRTVTSTTSFTDSATAMTTGWSLSGGPSFILGATGPSHLIIGAPETSGEYSIANSSVTNGPHQLHLLETATFTLSVPGLTSVSQIEDVSFGFGTGTDTTGASVVPAVGSAVPLPASVWTGLGLLGAMGLTAAVRARRGVRA